MATCKIHISPCLEAAVDPFLGEQQRYPFGVHATPRSKVWLEVAGGHAFGAGLATLLEAVVRRGSLREAARTVHMSYRHALDLVHGAEAHLGRPLLQTHAGGAHGGGSILSADGHRLVGLFHRLRADVAAYTELRFGELLHASSVTESSHDPVK